MNARFSQKFISPLKRAKTDITDITNYTCINHHKSILSLWKPFIDKNTWINGLIQKNFKFYLILVLVTWCHRYIINYWVLEIEFHRITEIQLQKPKFYSRDSSQHETFEHQFQNEPIKITREKSIFRENMIDVGYIWTRL